MARFVLTGERDSRRKLFVYDNLTSELLESDGTPVPVQAFTSREYGPLAPLAGVSAGQPVSKVQPAVLKVQLGLSCNYSCEYCSQRFVPHADQTGPDDVAEFVAQLVASVDLGQIRRVEFWGGEPFVYWKTLRPLAEALRVRMPDAQFLIITNGSLLDMEKNFWLERTGFSVGISHDGPGQHVRGPDPLDDMPRRVAILDLYRRLRPLGRISFNAMLNRSNTSRAAIAAFFVELTGDPDVPIGEGSFIDPYDAGGLANSLDVAGADAFAVQAFEELRAGSAANFGIAAERIAEIVDAIANRRPASALGQKCGMDRPDRLAVDLRGRVLTCQNVSAAAMAPNGRSHHIGDLDALEQVRLDTATHFAHRAECRSCPVLQQCKGSCMFLQGAMFEAACRNAWADHLPFFMAAFEFITGFHLMKVFGPHRIERHLIPDAKRAFKRTVIPIVNAKVIPNTA